MTKEYDETIGRVCQHLNEAVKIMEEYYKSEGISWASKTALGLDLPHLRRARNEICWRKGHGGSGKW